MFSTVAGLLHISGCIAGTKNLIPVEANTMLVSRSSAIPAEIFAMMSAVAGAITTKSFSLAIEICGTFSTSVQNSVTTLRPDRASHVALPTKFKLAEVGTTSTINPSSCNLLNNSQDL